MVYSEPWYIKKPCIFITPTYPESSQTSKDLRWSVFAKAVNCYNYIHNISFSSSPLYEKKKKLNTGLIYIPEIFIRCKLWGPRKPEAGGRKF